MWLPSNDHISSASETCLFALQAWHELLDPHAPDTFQARVLDIPILLDEIEGIAERATEQPVWLDHLKSVGSELREAVLYEEEFLTKHSELGFHLRSLSQGLSAGNLTGKEAQELSKVSSSLFGDPIEMWLKDLAERAQGLPKQKHNFLKRLNCLATQARNMRFDAHALTSMVTDAGCSAQAEIGTMLQSIRGVLQTKPGIFDCIFAVKGDQHDIRSIIDGSGFRLARKGTDRRGDQVTRDFENASPNTVFVYHNSVGRSYLAAAYASMRHLETRLNVFNFYENSPEPYPLTNVLVYPPNDGPPVVVKLDAGEHLGLLPRTEARKIARDTLHMGGTRLDGRIENALEHYSSALASVDPRTAMVNFWTGLEALVGNNGPQSIGERIRHWIAPIIAWRRVDKICTYISISGSDFLKHTGATISSEHLPHSHRTFVSSQDVLKAVCGNDENPAIMDLFKAFGRSQLMCYRLHEAWRDMSDPELLKKSLEHSRQRVEWQLTRIYRARNLLVHRGEISDLMPRLLQNAQYYLSTALGRVLHDLRDNTSWTASTSLAYQRRKFDYVVESLGKGGRLLTVADFLPRDVPSPGDLLWPASAVVANNAETPLS